MPKKILLVGCGQLGSRHLQAISSLKNISQIHIVDPNSSSIEQGKARLKEISDINGGIDFKWFNGIKADLRDGDLCIVATQAKGRGDLIKGITRELGYKKFLIEKIVTQSVKEYKDLMDFCERNSLSIWVNCKTRAYSVHKYIKSKIKDNEKITFSDFGGNHGLANNGVHSSDLFIFYDGSDKIHGCGSKIDPVLHPSKRGKDIYDLSGTLCGFTEKGSKFILSFSSEHNCPDHISILSAGGRFIVDHMQRFAYESYPESDWKWQPLPFEGDIMVSHMTKIFVKDILSKGSCELPTLSDCFPAHEFILGQLLPHFNRLLKVENDFCPVT